MADNEEILLLDEFKQWLKFDVTPKVISNYASYLRKINRDFISRLNTGSKDTPFALLKKHFNSSTKGPNIKFVEQLLLGILSNINRHQSKLLETGSSELKEFLSEKNAFRSYVRFLNDYILAMPHRKCALAPTHEAAIKNLIGDEIVLDQEDLIDNFTSRINSQDRNTGDKTFLPIGLIGKILARGQARDWAKQEAGKVRIHVLSGTVKVTDISTLKIDTQTREVYVRLSDGRWERVFNPELNGKKEPIFLSQLQFSDLDHDPEIHTILQDFQGHLPGLDLLTMWIKRKQKELGYKTINTKNYDRIDNELYADPEFQSVITEEIKGDIQADVDKVSSHHILQFTSAEWNRSDKKQSKKTSK